MKTRNQALDILRAVAVLLVVQRHASIYAGAKAPVTLLAAFLTIGGWVGVDLFFVLSGFLIAQLLFKEHKKFGDISFKTFFIRRGFKIYPPYYFMMLVTGLILLFWNVFNFRQIFFWSFPWLFYMQDYTQNPLMIVWGHTWSLAVEEQFYLFLPLLLILLTKTRASKDDPFRLIPVIFIFIGVACLLMRLMYAAIMPFYGMIHLTPFHVRLDSLFCGVFISYLYHYHAHLLFVTMKPFRYLWLSVGIALLLPAFLFELSSSLFMYTFGYTFLYIGNALIMIAALVTEWHGTDLFAKTASYIGARSYSIYLWHLPILWLIHQPQVHLLKVTSCWLYVIYVAMCAGFGIIVSNIIEFPMLKLRDRWYPSRSG